MPSQYSWYPINLYDPREGFPRDAAPAGMANPACYVNGIMNAVEFDVGNFRKWLLGTVPGGSGPLVSYSSQNGYLVYFSDRRGMLPDPNNGNITSGEYGFEDVINSASPTGTPDGVLEPSEDVDQNAAVNPAVSVWGTTNVGDGLRLVGANSTNGNPYRYVNCATLGRQNIVTGARHVLKLVDGGLGNLPVRPDTGLGGFTVASENPVYIQGNYNSDSTDPFWLNPPPAAPADINHSAAAVIADAVTVLSNNWSDTNSMLNPLNLGGRAPNTPTYYRLAIAGGKNINFPQPAGTGQDFGTDGGVHNFLRYIEAWGGSGGLVLSGIAGQPLLLAVRDRYFQVLQPGLRSAAAVLLLRHRVPGPGKAASRHADVAGRSQPDATGRISNRTKSGERRRPQWGGHFCHAPPPLAMSPVALSGQGEIRRISVDKSTSKHGGRGRPPHRL